MEGWIHEGWCCQEGKLLLQLGESQDKRQLLGGNYRVLQDREESGQKETVLVVRNKDEVDIKIQEKLLQEDFCQEES